MRVNALKWITRYCANLGGKNYLGRNIKMYVLCTYYYLQSTYILVLSFR